MQQQAMWKKYTNKNEVAIAFSRKREHEHYISGMFVRLFV